MIINENRKSVDHSEQICNLDHSFDFNDMSIIQSCHQQKKVILYLNEYLIREQQSFYINFTVDQVPNNKAFVMYITNYRIYLVSVMDSEQFMIPHAYIKEYTYFDNQIRFMLKTSIKIFLTPQQTSLTPLIYQRLMDAKLKIPFCLNFNTNRQGTQVYDCLAEMDRMLINWTKVLAVENRNGKECLTYPKTIFVPSKIQKSIVQQCQRSRVNGRIPTLTFYIKEYDVAVWRCGRTIQDHNNKYDYCYLQLISKNLLILQLQQVQSKQQAVYGFNHFKNQIKYISYKFDSLYQVKQNYQRFVQAYMKNDPEVLKAGGKWFQEVDFIIKCTFKSVQHLKTKRNLLIQQHDLFYSDSTIPSFNKGGVDRASQIAALISIVSDPYYRSIQGLFVLIDKQFVSFGYPFNDRCGYKPDRQAKIISAKKLEQNNLTTSVYKNQTNTKTSVKSSLEPSHTFIQFLQCLNQLLNAFPHSFQYSSEFLGFIGYQLYTGKFSNFIFNSIFQKQNNNDNKFQSIKNCALKMKHFNLQFIPNYKQIKNLTDLRKNSPNIKEFIIWKQYWIKVTQMKGEENQRQQLMEAKLLKQFYTH